MKCPFCDVEDTLDYDPLATVYLNLNGMQIGETDILLEDGNMLSLTLWSDDCDILSKERVKINYCPLCGRKLEPRDKG